MRAGKLDRTITVITAPTGADSKGEPTTPGTEVCTIPARALPTRGRELVASARDVPEIFDRFIIRYRTDLDETMQVEYGGGTYQIHRIVELGRREGLELTCRRVK